MCVKTIVELLFQTSPWSLFYVQTLGESIKVISIQVNYWVKNLVILTQLSRLVDWLRVPTPKRVNRVRAWVKVVGSEIFHFRVQWKTPEIYFWRHLAWKAASKHLSEGELESNWPCSIYENILQSSTKSRIRPSTVGNQVTLTMKAKSRRCRQFPMIKQLH